MYAVEMGFPPSAVQALVFDLDTDTAEDSYPPFSAADHDVVGDSDNPYPSSCHSHSVPELSYQQVQADQVVRASDQPCPAAVGVVAIRHTAQKTPSALSHSLSVSPFHESSTSTPLPPQTLPVSIS